MIKAIVFDCFGVLMLEARQSFAQIHQDKFDEIHEITRQADSGLIDRNDQITAYAQITDKPQEEIEEYLMNEHCLNQDLVDVIKSLKTKYKIGMISNIGADWYERLVPEDVRLLFDQTILSGEVGMVKPYPEIFELACFKFNMKPSEMIFIDDILDNCEGARAVGIQSIHYKNTAQVVSGLNSLSVTVK